MQQVKPIFSKDNQRSFGRVRGRGLRAERSFLVNNKLPEISLDLQSAQKLLAQPTEKYSKICLEIGFGGGEHLAEYAALNPDTLCIGCETFINGVASLLQHIHHQDISNIRIFHGDARVLMNKIPNNIINNTFILFPDPWPKTKHHKKRFITNECLDIIARIMVPDGILQIATDHVDYYNWIAKHLDGHSSFSETSVTKNKRQTPPPDWIPTRYQEKAKQQGREANFFHYTHTPHNK